MGRPSRPQNDKINFMSPAALVDEIMLSQLGTHDKKTTLKYDVSGPRCPIYSAAPAWSPVHKRFSPAV